MSNNFSKSGTLQKIMKGNLPSPNYNENESIEGCRNFAKSFLLSVSQSVGGIQVWSYQPGRLAAAVRGGATAARFDRKV